MASVSVSATVMGNDVALFLNEEIPVFLIDSEQKKKAARSVFPESRLSL